MTTSPKITARIEKSLIDNALWLFIDRNEDRTTVAEDLPFERVEDEGNVAYPVLESELVAIRDAVDVYLASKEL
jgi:hypothetical protein